ncbi:MAG: MoxR family ATPase [Akkermansia sp.]|nr:MoxR family ATPase [Akkermansia sp.]
MDTREFNELIVANSAWISSLREEIAKVVIGQQLLIDKLILSLLCKGHVLLEGVPGLAKTLSVKALAGTLHAQFSRIQFTPDLLPADLIGTMIYNPEDRAFSAKKGPIFANLILADEINRAPAKVQSALLEAMQERQVTLGENTYQLPDPFLVLATQNPIDQEGTYQLPEAQMDRFLFKVLVTYPTRAEELQVLELMASSAPAPTTTPVTSPEQVATSRNLVNQIYIDAAVRGYIVDLVRATRLPESVDAKLKGLIRAGASPRATINMALAARAHAFMHHRSFVTPQDVKDLAHDILRHRILLSYEAEAENISTDDVIEHILNKVPVP